MSIDQKNNNLLKTYTLRLQSIKELENKHKNKAVKFCADKPGLSAPFLIKYSEEYIAQPLRLMVVGQETFNCWYRTSTDIEISSFIQDQMDEYAKYVNKEETQPQSPFWQAIKLLKRGLNLSLHKNNKNIIWTNICKYDYNGKRPSIEIQKEILDAFSIDGRYILLDEIEIFKPDVIVFFTGPQYDWYFEKIFGPELHKKQIDPNFSIRGFAKIELKNVLPEHTYRLYHPNYLRRTKSLDDVINKIIEQIQG